MPTAIATFAAGCFWGVEEAFRKIAGVLTTKVGYSGGHTENPTYQQVCTGQTGHAETVQIEYDPTLISYEKLLETFWEMHDPTQWNRQGPDIGNQYRSIIFYHNPEQLSLAQASKAKLPNSKAVVTQIIPAQNFYLAEPYHQQYLKNRRHSDE